MRNVQLLDKHIPFLHFHIARLEWSGTYTTKLFKVRWLDGWLMDKYLQNLSRHKTIHIDITVQKVIFSSWHQVISICPDEIVFYTIPLIYSLKHIKTSKSVFALLVPRKDIYWGITNFFYKCSKNITFKTIPVFNRLSSLILEYTCLHNFPKAIFKCSTEFNIFSESRDLFKAIPKLLQISILVYL